MTTYKIRVRKLPTGEYEATCGEFGAIAPTERQAIRLCKKFVADADGRGYTEAAAGGSFFPPLRTR